MSRRRLDRFKVVCTCTAVLLVSGWGAATATGKGGAKGGADSPVVPADSKKFAKQCGRLSTEWWQWLFSIPADRSPGADTTGEDAAQNQSGNVWFLDGAPDADGTVVRNVTIPRNKALFFPIFTYAWVNLPDFGDPPWSDEQEAAARQIAEEQVDLAEIVTVEVDGKSVANIADFRCQTDRPFMVTMPEGNLFDIPAGTYGPSVADGYYLLLEPLSPGPHTIHFVTRYGDAVQDVTYHLTVAGR